MRDLGMIFSDAMVIGQIPGYTTELVTCRHRCEKLLSIPGEDDSIIMRNTWLKYLENPKGVDEGQFTSLLTDAVEAITPDEAFSSFAGGVEVAKRCRTLIENTTFYGLYYLPKESHVKKSSDIKLLAEDIVYGMCDFLREVDKGGIADGLVTLPWKLTENLDNFHKIETDSYQHQVINLLGRRRNREIFEKDERIFGVREAVMGMTMDWYVTDYIISAAVSLPISYKPGFDIYINGGQIAVLHDMILLYAPG